MVWVAAIATNDCGTYNYLASLKSRFSGPGGDMGVCHTGGSMPAVIRGHTRAQTATSSQAGFLVISIRSSILC